MRSEPTGRVAYTMLRGTRPMLGEAEVPMSEDVRRRLDGHVAGLAGGRAGDGRALIRMGVQYILVPRPARDPLTRVLDATPELTRLSRTGTFGLWRLPSPAGRLMLLDGGTTTPLEATSPDGISARVRIPPGSATRTLLLAEPADGGWRAGLDGREVASRTMDGWAQGYEIPASGGLFELSRSMWLRHIWVSVQGVALLLVVVLALPGAPPEAAPAASSGRHGRRRGQRARVVAGSLARRAAAGAGRGTDALRARIHHDPRPAADIPEPSEETVEEALETGKPGEDEVAIASEERS